MVDSRSTAVYWATALSYGTTVLCGTVVSLRHMPRALVARTFAQGSRRRAYP